MDSTTAMPESEVLRHSIANAITEIRRAAHTIKPNDSTSRLTGTINSFETLLQGLSDFHRDCADREQRAKQVEQAEEQRAKKAEQAEQAEQATANIARTLEAHGKMLASIQESVKTIDTSGGKRKRPASPEGDSSLQPTSKQAKTTHPPPNPDNVFPAQHFTGVGIFADLLPTPVKERGGGGSTIADLCKMLGTPDHIEKLAAFMASHHNPAGPHGSWFCVRGIVNGRSDAKADTVELDEFDFKSHKGPAPPLPCMSCRAAYCVQIKPVEGDRKYYQIRSMTRSWIQN